MSLRREEEEEEEEEEELEVFHQFSHIWDSNNFKASVLTQSHSNLNLCFHFYSAKFERFQLRTRPSFVLI